MVMFTFSLLDQKYILWANFNQKIKILSLSWNLVPTSTEEIFEKNSSFHVK